jgi:hypothetical protein
MVFLNFITGISWFSSQLMPDIFSGLAILVLPILLLNTRISWLKHVFLSFILLFSLIVHVSNLLSILLLYLLFSLIFIGIKKYRPTNFSIKRHLITGMVVLSGWIILPAIHYTFGGKFQISNSSHVFLMARLVENGMADHYLKHYGQWNTKLYQYKDQLPDNTITFIWDQNSPLYKTGGWEANREEYSQIIKATLTKPNYLAWHASEATQATLRQLTHSRVGDGLYPYLENTNPFWKVQEYFKYELKEYTSSLQNRNNLKFDEPNERYELFLLISLLVVLLYLKYGNRTSSLYICCLSCIIGIVCNAAVSASMGNVLDRLQGRVIWILPLVALLACFELWQIGRTQIMNFIARQKQI